MSLVPALLALVAALPQNQEANQAALEAVEAKIAELGEASAAEDEAWLEAYRERAALLRELTKTAAERAELPRLEDLESAAAALQAEIDALRREPEPTEVRLDSVDDLGGIERAAKAAGAELVTAQAAVDGLNTRIKEAEAELGGLQGRGERAGARAADLSSEDDLTRYRLESAQLEARVVSERAGFLTESLSTEQALREQLQLELEKAELLATRAQTRAELARKEATRLREADAQAAREEAQKEADRAARERDPIERYRLGARAEASAQQAQAKDFETRLEQLKTDAAGAAEAISQVVSERESLEHRLELRPQAVDVLLRRHLERSRRAKRLIDEAVLPGLDTSLEELQVEQTLILDRLWNLRLPDDENPELLQLLDELPGDRHEEAREAFATSLKEDGLVAALELRSKQLDDAIEALNETLLSVREREQQLHELEDFILARMLWTQTDPPIDTRALRGVVQELARIPQPYREDGTWSRLREHSRSRLPLLALALGAIVGLHFLTRRLTGWSSVAGARPPPVRVLSRVLAALGWALGPVLQLWTASWAIRAIGPVEAFDPPVANLLWYLGELLAVRRLTKVLLGKGGLIAGEHGVDPQVGLQIARSVAYFTIVGQAFYVPYLVLSGSPFELQVLPRLLYAGWILMGTVALLMLIRPKGPVVQHWTAPGSLLRSLLAIVRFFWLAVLVPLIALDLMGYRVGVETSLLNGLKVFALLFVLGALFKLLERLGQWISGRQPRPTGEHEARIQASRERAARSMTRVLASLIVVFVAVATAKSWGIGDPLMKLAAEFELLQLGDGSYLNGRDVLLALLIIVVGHLISANLRRFHEVLVEPFSETTDVGGRYASITLFRYAVMGLAYAAAMLTLGLSFEALGWFATAASVGLGFGLQEIVANFISGLILLFERPIRVGDIVTIGSTSGTIDSISMRATVITNWEKQTIIVPNKKFVTENLTNWTSTDSVMRRQFIVRVAYGSDLERVFRLLEETVKAHPAVLEKPAPIIWLQEFGLVGIEFKVLFYTSIDVGLGTRSQIQAAVKARFEQEGIEMPTIDSESGALLQEGEKQAGSAPAP
jgi:potassium efflux system protein